MDRSQLQSIVGRRRWLISAFVIGAACGGSELGPPPPGNPGLDSLHSPSTSDGGDDDDAPTSTSGDSGDDDDVPRPDLGDPDDTGSSSEPTATSSEDDPDTGGGIWGPCEDPACPPGMDCFEQDGSIGSC